MSLMVHPFFDPDSCAYSYEVVNPESRACAIIDAVLNYDLGTGETSTVGADQLVDFVRANGLIVEWILDTHVHADHLSAQPVFFQPVLWLPAYVHSDPGPGPHRHHGDLGAPDKLLAHRAVFLVDGAQLPVLQALECGILYLDRFFRRDLFASGHGLRARG